MILGIGNDLCDIRRIDGVLNRFENRFIQRCFTVYEQKRTQTAMDPAAQLAKFFAAKEACAKALGTGFSNGVYLRDIGVIHDSLGKPMIELTGGAKRRLDTICPDGKIVTIHLSLSDEPPYANAMVVIESI